MLSLELVKTRLAVMSMEMRKNFIQAILTSLIEKSPDAKILRAVVKIVEEWVKNNSPMAASQVSSERAVLGSGICCCAGRSPSMACSALLLTLLRQHAFSHVGICRIFC